MVKSLRRKSQNQDSVNLMAYLLVSLFVRLLMALFLIGSTFISALYPAAAQDPAATEKEFIAQIERLIESLINEDGDAQDEAILSLGHIGDRISVELPAIPMSSALKEAAVPVLIAALKENEDIDIQSSAASALGLFGEAAKSAVPSLIAALKDGRIWYLQDNAARTLGFLRKEAKDAVPALIEALKVESEEVQSTAIEALGLIGAKPEISVPALIAIFKDGDQFHRSNAAYALAGISTSLRDAEETRSLEYLRQARAALEKDDDYYIRNNAETIGRNIEYLDQLWWSQIFYWAVDNKGKLALAALYPLWLVTSLLIFWRDPTVLLIINEKLRSHEYELFEFKFPLRHLLIVGFFNYHPRLLDAWVTEHVGQARENFVEKRTVSDRSVHIPMPVELDGSAIAELEGSALSGVFTEGFGLLLICGEGGAGKTSIACQIARWCMAEKPEHRATPHIMLPVLIELELKDDFIEPIRGGLQRLIEKPGTSLPSVPVHLFQELLKQRRILVIVDHLSEMTAKTRELVRPHVPDFPIGALIVTSRIEEELGGVPKTNLRPMRVTGDYLFEFMGAYLKARGVRELFPDKKFGEAGGRIAELVGERQVTVLLVKLFLDQMIRRAERSNEGENGLPQNIPDLMLRYVNDINESIPKKERRDPLAVHKDSQAVAWACLEETFRPAAAEIDDDVLPAIKAIEEKNANERLTYLDERLHLVEIIEPRYDKIRYLLDPLAEYLAGMHLVGSCRDNKEKWKEFLAQADEMKGDLEAIRGFLLAVYDCCIAKQKDENIPQFAIDECAKRVAH